MKNKKWHYMDGRKFGNLTVIKTVYDGTIKFELEDREKEYVKNQLIEEILSKLIFEGASLWMDDKGRECKKSIE